MTVRKALVEVSSTLRILTFAGTTLAAVATLEMNLLSSEKKSALDIGKVITMITVSDGIQTSKLLFP